jgi:hypothetical protein
MATKEKTKKKYTSKLYWDQVLGGQSDEAELEHVLICIK